MEASTELIVLLIGIVIGAVLTAKPTFLRDMNDTAFGYTLLGVALVGATLMLSWAGFACVIAAFLFYHMVGRDGWSEAIRSFFSFKWLKRKPQEPEEPLQATPRVVEPEPEQELLVEQEPPETQQVS